MHYPPKPPQLCMWLPFSQITPKAVDPEMRILLNINMIKITGR